jgi:NADPH2:quinone reductase
MQALCVTDARTLERRDVPTPTQPAPGHLLVDLAGAAINHGDKAFLAMPAAAGPAAAPARHGVWGASAAGRVMAIGAGVPDRYLGRQVALYRSLKRTDDTIGSWSDRVQAHYLSAVVLPDHVDAIDYAGSLVNVMTAYAFLADVIQAGHKAVIVTAGSSATGHALAVLAMRRGLPAIYLVRSEAARAELQRAGVEHVVVQEGDYLVTLGRLAAELDATAIFDGVGGALPGVLAPHVPMHSTMYCYGFLAGAVPFTMPTSLLMMKDLTLKRFSNFETATVKDPAKLEAALLDLHRVIDHPFFRTRVGATFGFDDIDAAMAYEGVGGRKALLRPSP